MDYAALQRRPGKRLLNFGLAVLLHVVLLYGLMHGLARDVVRFIQPPVEAEIIEAPKTPPPEVEPVPLPDIQAPPPPSAFIPPPEVRLPAPVDPPASITAFTTTPPPEQVAPIRPTPPVVTPPAPPPPVAREATVSAQVACSNFTAVKEGLGDKFAVIADAEGIQQAEVMLKVTAHGNGQIGEVVVQSSSNQSVAKLARSAVRRLQCNTGGQTVQVLVPFSFKLED
ncbi:hypothetical protein QWZ03_00155 [Chitinimonas viridis]|uniref:Energy transducer TonB n=1 Tax=Chitinimonas viridis TaxID=664880 RepID=A0ABT8AYW0_9NEIS|nr:hypothetical protein [Chitinimonas viridis]MDN3575184.1 hypothetical protein [Chitinimonas viridis]